MGKYLGSLVFLAGVGMAAPLAAASTVNEAAGATVTAAVQHVRAAGTGLRDEAAMVLVGTALIGLAAAVRRHA